MTNKTLKFTGFAIVAMFSTVLGLKAADGDKPLYDRLGGQPAVEAVAGGLVDSILLDKRVNAWFAHTAASPANTAAYKAKLSEFICQNTGGPCTFGVLIAGLRNVGPVLLVQFAANPGANQAAGIGAGNQESYGAARAVAAIREFRAGEDEVLNITITGWDASKTAARIPIEDAIDIVARKGFPSKPFKGGEGVDEEGFRLLPENSSSGRTYEKIAQ